MPEDFDPYHRWLGIQPTEQPADHYRLLGLVRFEADVEVIRDAASRQMGHVRTYQLGPQRDLTHRILNELGAAKGCLLDPAKKAAYDDLLRKKVGTSGSRSSPTEAERGTATSPSADSAEPIGPPPNPQDELRGFVESLSTTPVTESPRRPKPAAKELVTTQPRRSALPNRSSVSLAGLGEAVVTRLRQPAWFVPTIALAAVGFAMVAAFGLRPGTSQPENPSVASAGKVKLAEEQTRMKGEEEAKQKKAEERAEEEDARRKIWEEQARKAEEEAQGRKSEEAMKAQQPALAIAPFDATTAKQHQQAWAKFRGETVEVTNSIGFKLLLIPPGEFLMGSPDSDIEADAAEKPQHRVQITKPFYLGLYEVTQGQYQQVMGTNPSNFKASGEIAPVEKVSWDDVQEFFRKLSALAVERAAGRQYRLPTEAEWEYACRAGSTTKYSFGDSESELANYAWYGKNSGSKMYPVGQKQPNAWGLYDMHGNVWEWCQDSYGSYEAAPVSDASGLGSASFRVFRGGGWSDPAAICRSAFRLRGSPSLRGNGLGFRLAAVQSPR